jgi:dynein heavy chain
MFIGCLQGNVALERSKRKKHHDWMPDVGWEDLVRLNEVAQDTFGSLLDEIDRNEKVWKEVLNIEYFIYCGC